MKTIMEIGKIYKVFEAYTDGTIVNRDKVDYIIPMFQHNDHSHCLNITKIIDPDSHEGYAGNIDDDHPHQGVNPETIKQFGSQIIPRVFTWTKD
jgi:hypothetical protein